MQDQDKTKEQLIDELNEIRRKVAEFETVQQSLSETESRCREIVDETSAAIFVIQDGQIKFVNNATLELTGYSKKEGLSSQAIETFVHPDDRDMVNQYHIRRLQGDNSPFRYNYRFVCKDGTVKWAEMNSSLIMWEGKPAGLCLVRDITERKRSEEALQESEIVHRALCENIPGIVYRVQLDEPVRMQFFNSTVYAITGFKETELTDGEVCSIDPLIVEEDRARVVDVVKQALAEDKPFEVEYRIIHKSGSIRHLREYGRPIRSPSGELCFIDGVIFDDTSRKQTEDALRESEERFSKSFKNNPAFLTIVHMRTYKILEVNGAWTRLFGYTREEAIGRTAVELGIFDEATYRKIMEEANTKGSIQEIEVNIKSRTGEDKVLLVSREALEIMGEPYLLAMGIDISDRKRLEEEKEKAIVDLQNALSEVKRLSGFLPICASCKKIRDDKGYWNEVERYIGEHSEALFSHSICPDCMRKLYPEIADEVLARLEKVEKK